MIALPLCTNGNKELIFFYFGSNFILKLVYMFRNGKKFVPDPAQV